MPVTTTTLFIFASSAGGTGSGMLAAAGLSYPKGRLGEIKKTAQASSDIIKQNMESANDSLFDGGMDFLGAFDVKPIIDPQKKTSSLDILNEFLYRYNRHLIGVCRGISVYIRVYGVFMRNISDN